MTSDEVIDQLAAVRESGAVNMMDRNGVRKFADRTNFRELVEFIDENDGSAYVEALKRMGRER